MTLYISLFDIGIAKEMCSWAIYFNSFSESYRNNRNRTFLLKLFCLASDEVEDLSIFYLFLNYFNYANFVIFWFLF